MPDRVRTEFEEHRGFPLDRFQHRALDALDAGTHVLVAAPTGSGKTVVAEYAIARALADGGKAFYTTPLKALSNQKYGDLVREHGASAVGLLTGDNSVHGDARVVVMTTEVLRNMIYAASPALDGLQVVVLDEVHYLQDRYRGPVWEEVIVHLAETVKLVCLSATVSNAEEVAAWIQTVRGPTTAIIEEERPVRLEHRYLVAERATDRLHLLPTFVAESDASESRGHGTGAPAPALVPNPEAARLDSGRSTRGRGGGGRERDRGRSQLRTPGRVETVELLSAERMLPAIDFVFSRAGCDQAVEQCLGAGLSLTEPGERAEIREIVERKTEALTDEDLDVLHYSRWLAGIEAGFAAHHAGMVPPMKEAVEEAFAAGLVKVVFATETLALGINMPARTVVIEKLSKFTGERHEFLTPGEYTQLTGRAGRRGIDDLGYAVVCWSPFVPFDQVAALASRRTDALRSSFRPTYNMAANLVRRYDAAEAHHLLNLSFAQFHADRDVVAMERQLGRNAETLARARATAHSNFGDIEDYRRLQGQLNAARREDGVDRKVEEALRALKPGDVILHRRRGGRLAILAHDRGRADTRLLALSPSRGLVRLGVDDFDSPPQAVAHIELPQPHAPRSTSFRKQTADRLRRVKLRDSGPRSRRDAGREAQLAEALATHPAARDPDLAVKLKAAAAAERLERDVARTERRVRGRSESLARQFDRVLRVLESWGYVDGWSLTEAGERLARLYTETDLMLAEAIGEGLLDGLRAPELAAVVSCFTYERRGPDAAGTLPPPRWPTKTVAQRVRAIERIARDLNHNEDDAGLPETRGPDPGFTLHIAEWVGGDPLADVLEDEEMTGGDFVRNVKQCIDLLGQVATVAPDPHTRDTARSGGGVQSRCCRGFERRRSEPARPVIRKGEPWGHTPGGTADIDVSGDDATLAAAITAHPRARVAFRPSSGSDFARAVGISAAAPPTTDATSELPCDLLRIRTDTGTAAAVNMAILGVPPDRQRWTSRTDRVRVTVDGRVVHEGPATAVVIANGQYLRGADVVPRGHPGDGRAEVHVYALTRSERRGMRARLPRGEHVPHPRITVAGGRTIVVDSLASPFPVELDGVPCDRSATVTVEVTPSAFSLLL